MNSAFKIHNQYGPGLFESVYGELMFYELGKERLDVKRQISIPLVHESIKLDAGFRADLIVNGKVLIEVKSIECLAPIHYK